MQHGVAVDSGVIHQNVYRAKRLFGTGKQGFDLRFSAILQLINSACAPDSRREAAAASPCASRSAIITRAPSRASTGNAKADTACGAGDNGGFTGKFHSNVPYESEDEFRDRCSARPQGGGANNRLSIT